MPAYPPKNAPGSVAKQWPRRTGIVFSNRSEAADYVRNSDSARQIAGPFLIRRLDNQEA